MQHAAREDHAASAQGPNANRRISDDGIELLLRGEGRINGLYDDSAGLATYGIGTLVHAQRLRQRSLLLHAARTAGGPWVPYVRRRLGRVYLDRAAATAPGFSELVALARTLGREDRAITQYQRAYAALPPSQRLAIDNRVDAAVSLEATLLTREPLDVFRARLPKYEAAVRAHIHIPLTQREYDALVSFAYNTGAEGFPATSVARTVNAGRYRTGSATERRAGIEDVDRAFGSYVREFRNGRYVVSAGLVNRRAVEAALFLSDARAALAALR
ncbi:MAG: lysozyme [Gemmatimonadaceae bacterium]|nr:lysozyme [Gemmatimonadaceae bacterium]